MSTKEFIINEYISLRLEGVQTVIYIKGKKFRHCKYLLINITPQNFRDFDEMRSIDEVAEFLDHSLDSKKFTNMTPEIEFWGHCSNLQAWEENEYNPKLIHSNLSRPLLKELTKVGDPIAKARYKEEIIKKYINCEEIFIYLSIKERDLDFFEEEEIKMLLGDLKWKKVECYWFFLPFLVNSGYLQLNRNELEDLVEKSYRRVHTGKFNKINVDGALMKEFYQGLLEFERYIDNKR